MKKVLFIVALMFGVSGVVQAAAIDGETAGTDKHRVVGFGINDAFVAQGQVSGTTVSLTDNGTPVNSSTSLDTTGIANGFIHDFVFQAVQDTFAAVTSAIQLSSGATGQLISPLVVQVWHILGGADQLIGSGTLDAGANPSTSFGVNLVAGETYVVRMSNEGGTIGNNGDYTLNVLSPVPVPAAAWLFGTALLGMLGFGRKMKSAKPAAA